MLQIDDKTKDWKSNLQLKRQNHKLAHFTISYETKGSPCMQVSSGPAFMHTVPKTLNVKTQHILYIYVMQLQAICMFHLHTVLH